MDGIPNKPRHIPLTLILVGIPVGLLLFAWLFNTPPGVLGKADAVGYAVCHRIDVRSFHIGERPTPLCARCSGMYLGAVLGLAWQAIFRPRRSAHPPRPIIAVLALFVIAFGVDGVNSYLHLFPFAPSVYSPNNFLRLVTGTGMGLVMAAAVYPAYHQTMWQMLDDRPAITGFRDLLILVVLAVGVDALVWSENPILLYPLALISAAGVLLLLTMIYSMIVLLLLRRENTYRMAVQVLSPLTAGFGLALAQIAVLDLIRFAFTGTWEGFHFG